MTRNNNITLPPGGEITSRGKSVFNSIKTAAKKAPNPSTKGDYSLSNALAAVHIESVKTLNQVGCFVKDEPGMDDLESSHGSLGNPSATPGGEALTRLAVQEPPTQPTTSGSTTTSSSSTVVTSPKTAVRTKPFQEYHKAVILHSVAKPVFRTSMPKVGRRFTSTLQLAYAHHLLPKKKSKGSPMTGLVVAANDGAPELDFNDEEEAWMKAIGKDSVEQGHIRWLAAQVAAKFLETSHKGAAAIEEVLLLGAALDREDYRRVFSSLIGQLERDSLLDLHLTQGLIQFLQDASPGFLIDDDLVRILRVMRLRIKDTHVRLDDAENTASAHVYHLVTAVCRVLDAMMEGNVKGLSRTEDHKPLLDILAELRGSSDPCLNFQASYAWQALQYIGDDESPLHAALRFGGGVTVAALSIASVFKFDIDNLLNGLHELGLAAGQAFDVAKAGFEGAQALRDGGEGVMDSMLKGFRSGPKRAWYPALQGGRVCIREGRLAEFQRLIHEAPCRREREFQMGICLLLGEVAMDPIWETEIREQMVELLDLLFRDDGSWISDTGVKGTILNIICYISENAEQIIQCRAEAVMQSLTANGTGSPPRPYLLMTRLPHPGKSRLLSAAVKLPLIEYRLHQVMAKRREEYQKTIYIPPMAKEICPTSIYDSEDGSEVEKEEEPFLLMDRVMEFLDSDKQVFLILGDSGSGKSNFNKHLEYVLLKAYSAGGSIPLYINLPELKDPEKELIPEHLNSIDLTKDDIQDLKEDDRQLIIICDGYDEKQLSGNLHKSNMLNRRWNTKMIISCRTSYLPPNYQRQFQPQPLSVYDPPTFHLFQEVSIIPFSPTQIRHYVEQFVRDPNVHQLFHGRSIWSAEVYMEKLFQIRGVSSLAKNPFLLILSLRTLPKILDAVAIEFLGKLAYNIINRQQGDYVVKYKEADDKDTWKAEFFGPDVKAYLLREASPLTKAGHFHRFMHYSLLEYFYGFEVWDIFRLRAMRLREYKDYQKSVYIAPLAESDPGASDSEQFPLMDSVMDFLTGDKQVMLIQADSGAGKTAFCRHLEYVLWESYKEGDPIPLFVRLTNIMNPNVGLIPNHLQVYGTSTDVIHELKAHKKFILICD
ncbi:hypothetical protein EC991_006736, partial [Linnemannia zychae]